MPTDTTCAYCGIAEPLGGLIDHQAKGAGGYSWDVVCADARACSRRQDRNGQLATMHAELAASGAWSQGPR